MNVGLITGRAPQASDYGDLAVLQKNLLEHSDALMGMAADLGKAKHCLEFSSDMRKRALARAMAAPIAGGASATAAEAEGRASPGYSRELGVLAKQHEAAEVVIAEFEVRRIGWETCRSLLAAIREEIKRI